MKWNNVKFLLIMNFGPPVHRDHREDVQGLSWGAELQNCISWGRGSSRACQSDHINPVTVDVAYGYNNFWTKLTFKDIQMFPVCDWF